MSLTEIRASVRKEFARILLKSFDKQRGEDLGFFDLLILPIKLVEVIFRFIYSAVYAVARHLGDFGFIFMLPLQVASVFVFALTSPWRTIVKPISAYIQQHKDDPHYLFWAGLAVLVMTALVVLFLASIFTAGGVLPLFAFLGPIASWVGSGLGAVVSILGGGLFAQIVVGLSAVLFASALLVRLLTPLNFLKALFMGESESNALENPVSCLHRLDGINGNDKGYLAKTLTRGEGGSSYSFKVTRGREKKEWTAAGGN